ncbi:MAG: HAMP domain-containing histidine kinase [Ruminococcus sp.]|nr:HAMP domain-containing histidine kinase [Ruminococcus sp.]
MKVTDFLLQKSTRAIAFISACVIFAVCAGMGLNKFFEIQKVYNQYNDLKSTETNEEADELFAELWAVGNMYLRNLDENGNFVGAKHFRESTEKALKELGLMDSKGKITISKSDNFDYYVSWGNNSISTDNRSYNDIYESDTYSTTQINGNAHFSNYRYNYYYYGSANWYSTNYGMTYYDFPHTIKGIMATAVFDYDTKDLDYYVDDYGVKIYYKKDGSTPIPNPNSDSIRNVNITIYNDNESYVESYNGYYDENYSGYYNRYGEYVQPTVPRAEVIEEEPEEVTENIKVNIPAIPAPLLENSENDSYILYNKDLNEWVEVQNTGKQVGNEYPLKICITPSENLLPLYKQYQSEINKADEIMARFLIGCIPFLVLAVVLMGFFVLTSGYDLKRERFVMHATDRIWVEVVIATGVFLVIGAFCSVEMIAESYDFMNEYYNNGKSSLVTFWTTCWTAILSLIVLCVNTLIKRCKCGTLWETSLIHRVWKFVLRILNRVFGKIKSAVKTVQKILLAKDMTNNNIFAKRLLIKSGIFMIATIFACSIESIFGSAIIFLIYVLLIFKDVKAITELSKQIDEIYSGDYTTKEVRMDYPTYTMTEKLNNISDGIQTAVDKRLQSERMKIELVTNVSHDLKTPLTSIISYINLLSMEENLSPVARDYVKILENKSARLSEIVSDVFDIAKATSRTDINLEMIDAVILMEQVLGDMADRIEDSGKEIRKTVSAENAPVYADGKRLYRVLQNVIDNALKYSLDNTRIYLTLTRTIDTVTIKIKNISSYEIKCTPEELTERFTRGDESRTTEGNGLGLSIAKSFTEACGGKFAITIDGDVFEATVTLDIATKEKVQ